MSGGSCPIRTSFASSVRDLRDIHGVSEEAMANVVLESWRNRAFRPNEETVS